MIVLIQRLAPLGSEVFNVYRVLEEWENAA